MEPDGSGLRRPDGQGKPFNIKALHERWRGAMGVPTNERSGRFVLVFFGGGPKESRAKAGDVGCSEDEKA